MEVVAALVPSEPPEQADASSAIAATAAVPTIVRVRTRSPSFVPRRHASRAADAERADRATISTKSTV